MRKSVEQTSQRQESDRRRRELEKVQTCLDQTDWSAVDEAAKCQEAVPAERLLAMREIPTRFEQPEATAPTKMQAAQEVRVESQGKTEWQRLVEGARESHAAYLRDHPEASAVLAAGQEKLENKRVAMETGQDLHQLQENQGAIRRLERSRKDKENASDGKLKE